MVGLLIYLRFVVERVWWVHTQEAAMCRMAAWRARHRPQGPGGPARAYRYRLALRRPYRYRYRRWVQVDGGRGVPWVGL